MVLLLALPRVALGLPRVDSVRWGASWMPRVARERVALVPRVRGLGIERGSFDQKSGRSYPSTRTSSVLKEASSTSGDRL